MNLIRARITTRCKVIKMPIERIIDLVNGDEVFVVVSFSTHEAFEETKSLACASVKPATLPELAKERTFAAIETSLWSDKIYSNSFEYKGVHNGKEILVVAHGEGPFADPAMIKKRGGAGKLTQEEFKNLVSPSKPSSILDRLNLPPFSLEEFLSFPEAYLFGMRSYAVVLDGNLVRQLPSGPQKIDDLKENPLVIARFGGKKNTSRYLDKVRNVYGVEELENSFDADWDCLVGVPEGRWLVAGISSIEPLAYNDYLQHGFPCNRFIGIRKPHTRAITLDTVLTVLDVQKVPENILKRCRNNLEEIYGEIKD